jgi:hypothetical protein
LYKNLGSEAAIVMISMAAYELGIPYSMDLSGGINVIQGKAEISARTLNALLLRAGHKVQTLKHDETGCWLKGIRGDTKTVYEASFTIQEASEAGLLSKDVWKKYKKDMLWARAISRLARTMGPDTIGTYYVEGEATGEIKEASCEVIEPESPKGLDEEAVKTYSDGFGEEWKTTVKQFVEGYCRHYEKTFEEFKQIFTDQESCLAKVKQWLEQKKAREAVA